MRRIQLILAALVMVVTSFAAVAGPAVADDLNCRDARGDLIRCDGDLYQPYNDNDYYNYHNPYYYNPYFFNPYSYYYPYYYGFDSSCPFYGDFEGIVNQFDCY